MQLSVALYGKGGLAQEIQALGKMEFQKFLWLRQRVAELQKESSHVKELGDG
jgi:hypothetical protein